MKNKITPPNEDQKYRIWSALVLLGGAHDSGQDAFMRHWPDGQHISEHRFIGVFGFGGKIWWNDDRVYVSYYREDHNDQREAVLAILNTELSRIMTS
jgi:hypothetical protein